MKMRVCQYPNCSRRLVTGRKYCHIHRSFGREQVSGKDKKILSLFILWFVGLMFGAFFKIWVLVVICLIIAFIFLFSFAKKLTDGDNYQFIIVAIGLLLQYIYHF